MWVVTGHCYCFDHNEQCNWIKLDWTHLTCCLLSLWPVMMGSLFWWPKIIGRVTCEAIAILSLLSLHDNKHCCFVIERIGICPYKNKVHFLHNLQLNWLSVPGPWFNIKMSSYLYRKSHGGYVTYLWPSYLHNGISFAGKMTSLYWIRALVLSGFPWLEVTWPLSDLN